MPYKNKEDQAKCQRRYYERNSKYYYQKSKERKIILRNWFKEYKKTLKCSICGLQDHRCLDFHHLNGNDKEIELSYMIGHCYGKEKILKEINKCIILCSNCHRILHYDENTNIE